MKCRIKRTRNVKVDWVIFAITKNESDRENPELTIDYKTNGFSKYGYGEIVVCGKIKNAEKIKNLINTFGRMLAEGELFPSDNIHTIGDGKGNVDYRFGVVYGEYENGEKWVQLIPDFEWDNKQVTETKDGDAYVEVENVYINNRTYVTLEKDGKPELCRLDKLVWQSFVDDTLDISDDSWELGYKDGDYKNCALDNLYRVK